MSDMEQSKTYEVQSSVKKKKKAGVGEYPLHACPETMNWRTAKKH